MQKTPQDVLKDIKAKKFAPIYVLHGDEPYFIDQVADALEVGILREDEKSFNQFVLFGKDQTMGSVISYARRYPMMAERQVIIVKEASFLEALAKGKESKGNDDLKAWEDYCMNPTASTILIFTIKNLVAEKAKILALADKNGVIVCSKKIKEDKAGIWLKDYLSQKGLRIQASSVELMVSFVGVDLQRMAHEADKLAVNLPQGAEVGAEEIEQYIGISREYNIFEFQQALSNRNVAKAQKIAFYFAANTKQNPVPPMLIMLFNYFMKVLQVHDLGSLPDADIAKQLGVNPYFVRDYINAKRNYPLAKVVRVLEAIKNADLKVKGVIGQMASEREIILDLSFEILHL
jgi:DNA polymerase-3 subunit delta